MGDRIGITDASGKAVKGTLEAISADSLTLRQGTREPETFPAARVREVHTYVSDSLTNGIIAGAALGAVGGIALVADAYGNPTAPSVLLLHGGPGASHEYFEALERLDTELAQYRDLDEPTGILKIGRAHV